MRVSMKVDYGVRVLVELAQHYEEGLVQTSDIAQSQGIPEPYLDQLLTLLRRGGFILSHRGPQGGHALSRPPSDINLGEVMATLEGRTTPRCVEEPSDCPRSFICVQRDVWRQVEEAAQKLLQATTIGELAHQEELRHDGGVYYI